MKSFNTLFYRCLIPCALYEQFWAKYARYLERAHKEKKDLPKVVETEVSFIKANFSQLWDQGLREQLMTITLTVEYIWVILLKFVPNMEIISPNIRNKMSMKVKSRYSSWSADGSVVLYTVYYDLWGSFLFNLQYE